MTAPHITPEAREAALEAVSTAIWQHMEIDLGSSPEGWADTALDALIALGWGPTAEAKAEIVRLKNDVKELRDIRDLFVGWPTPIHMQDAMMEMRNRTWREAEARGYAEGVKSAVEVIDGEIIRARVFGTHHVPVLAGVRSNVAALSPSPAQKED